jgi:hypothetical protein
MKTNTEGQTESTRGNIEQQTQYLLQGGGGTNTVRSIGRDKRWGKGYIE